MTSDVGEARASERSLSLLHGLMEIEKWGEHKMPGRSLTAVYEVSEQMGGAVHFSALICTGGERLVLRYRFYWIANGEERFVGQDIRDMILQCMTLLHQEWLSSSLSIVSFICKIPSSLIRRFSPASTFRPSGS